MKSIIIVPSWIQRLLAREKMPVKDVLSFGKLCAVVSPQDLRALLLIQSYGPFTEYHIEISDANALLQAWNKNLPQELADELVSLSSPSDDNALDKELLKSLIQGEVREDGQDKGFEIIQGDHNTLLLILKDGYFGNQDYEEQDINIVENILRVLYGEFVQEEVAQTKLFKGYVVKLGNIYA